MVGVSAPTQANPPGAYPYSQSAMGEAWELAVGITSSIPYPERDDYTYYLGATGHENDTTQFIQWAPGVDWPSDAPRDNYAFAKCAQLVTASLKRAYGWDDAFFQNNFGSTSPFAKDYYDYIKNGTADHFEEITNIADVREGDLFVIKYPGKDDTQDNHDEQTGHVAFLVIPPLPYKLSTGETIDRDGNPQTTEYELMVVDSTSNPHGDFWDIDEDSPTWGWRDARVDTDYFDRDHDDSDTDVCEYSGLGYGWMFVQVDSAGAPTRYWWGSNEADSYTPAVHPFLFARITETE